MSLKELLKQEQESLLSAAEILDKAVRQTNGEGKLILNNAMGHVLSRVYQNGYFITHGVN